MKAMIKKIAIGAAAAAMAMSAVGMTASAYTEGKHPGESGCNYEELQNGVYGYHPGDAYYDMAVEVRELVRSLPADLGEAVEQAFTRNGYLCGNFVEEIKKEAAARAQAQKANHPGESGCNYEAMQNGFANENGKHPGESGFCYSDAEKTASESKQPGYLEAAENAVRAFIAEHPEYKIISTAAILGEGNCFYRVDAELKGVVHGPRMIFVVNDQICRKVDEKIYGKDGYSYEEEFNELGYNPSNYTDEQIKQIEAFRAENGFVSVTLLLKFDEENAAAQASAEKKPGEAGYNYFDGEETNADGKHPGECGYNYVNEYGKHPGESGYCYDANELGYDPSKYTEEQIRMIEASREVNGFVCGTLLMQFDEENAAKAKTEEKPQHATGLKVIGDVNCDGVIDVSDSVLLCRFLCEDADAVMTAQGRINADVNGDGKLTIDDNTALLDRIAKKE